MASEFNDYYVYVYIDPRNLQEFYYGKGRGTRKMAHLRDDGDSDKSRVIKAILGEGLKPRIKVIARDLSEPDALLVEKTLIWKLGHNLKNIATGHFAEKFRPHNTFHKELFGFDYKNGLYYVNVGQGPHRRWEDCRKFGFLSAGQDVKYSKPLQALNPGDIVAAYLKRKGYVGIGRVLERATRVLDFRIDGKPLERNLLVQPGLFNHADNEKTEFLIRVKWLNSFEGGNAKWQPGLYTTPLIWASLQNQEKTIDFLQQSFQLDISALLLEGS